MKKKNPIKKAMDIAKDTTKSGSKRWQSKVANENARISQIKTLA